mgnify:CR=1 FL=1
MSTKHGESRILSENSPEPFNIYLSGLKSIEKKDNGYTYSCTGMEMDFRRKNLGAVIGSYFVPDPNNVNFPKFETGTKTFTLVNDEDNNQDLASTIVEENFTSSGTLEVLQENILVILLWSPECPEKLAVCSRN